MDKQFHLLHLNLFDGNLVGTLFTIVLNKQKLILYFFFVVVIVSYVVGVHANAHKIWNIHEREEKNQDVNYV